MSNNSHIMRALTLEEVKKAAPQAFATSPRPGVSNRYLFLPTSRIIEDMDRLGWKVCDAKANRYRNSENQEYGNHIIKFFNPDVFIKDQNGAIEAYPNIVVMNNHTGRGRFKFEMGIFRLVCSNGLVIKDKDMGSFSLRHSGYTFEELQKTLGEAVDQLPEVVTRINTYSSTILSKEAQREFAQKAFQLRAGEERVLSAEDLEALLQPRRKEDEGDSLWAILNRVQEGVMSGGFMAVNKAGKLRKVKGIRNIQKDIQLNQQIWELGLQYA
jgi:hypothetical protein